MSYIKNKKGSALIIVLVVITVFSLWILNLLRQTDNMVSIARIKALQEQECALAQGLLEYGKIAANVLFEEWEKNPNSYQPTTCTFRDWPPDKKFNSLSAKYSGKLLITKNQHNITVKAELYKNNKVTCSLLVQLAEKNNKQDNLQEKENQNIKEKLPLYCQAWSHDSVQ